ncbi:MAG: PKD domain-containing protein [Bacteroidia bacterium]
MKYVFPFLLLLFILPITKLGAREKEVPKRENNITFTENKNQWDKKILYRAQLDGGALFLEKNAFTYNFYDKDKLRKNHIKSKDDRNSDDVIRSHSFRMHFLNSIANVTATAKDPTSDYCNYFIGKSNKMWASDVKKFTEIIYTDLYKDIDLQLIGLQNSMKYNFFVKPLGTTNNIQLLYEGLDSLYLEKGILILKTSINEIQEQRPYAYQWMGSKRVEVPCEFVLKNKTISFNFPKGYDKGYELVIDPVLVFACSSGSTADNFGMTATYDSEGNLYSGGTAFDIGYPVTIGAYDPTFNGATSYGRTDVVITKYDSSGTFLRYSTYIGGATGTEIVTSLVVNAQNELLLYGATGSSDFPVTPNAFDTTFNGGIKLRFMYNGSYFDKGTDIFVSKFNATGSTLLASTYIGGSLNDGVNVNNDSVLIFSSPPTYEFPADSLQYNYGDQYRGEINVDAHGNVYIASSTRSQNFPIVNGFDKKLEGKQDAVVFKLSSNLSDLLWSTYLGGKDNDAGYALVLDDSANVYVTGGTRSIDFPSTAGVLKPTYSGGKADGYVTKIKNDGTAILNSTFWGTASYDQCYFVQLDKNKNVYVVGQTEGAMPVTAGVYNNPSSGQFITKMNSSLDKLLFSTVFGNGNGTPNISPSAFLVDYCENIYVSGWGGNILTKVKTINMPVTPNAIQPSSSDGFNFYLFVLSPNAQSLLYATYFGGPLSEEHVDGGTSRFDKKGIVYQSVCAGCGGNDDFPVTPGAWPNTGANVNHSKNCNNGTFKLDFQIPLADASFTTSNLNGCAPVTIQLNYKNATGATYLWDFGNGTTSSSIENPTVTYTVPGTYAIKLNVLNPASCNKGDNSIQYVIVYPPMNADFDFIAKPCSYEVYFSDSSTTAPISWRWNFDDGTFSKLQNPKHVYQKSGKYIVKLTTSNSYGCTDSVEVMVDLAVLNPISINSNKNACIGNPIQLMASGGIAYKWTPSKGLNNTAIANPIASPDTTTLYIVTILSVNALGDTCSQQLSTLVKVFNPATFPLLLKADKDTLLEGESTKLHAITDTTIAVNWNPDKTLSSTTSYNPIATPVKTTTYTVVISDSSGCSKQQQITIYVFPSKCTTQNVFVPNTFSPNGDGKNDILYVRSNALLELYFAVYDRWGELMFETTDINKGWDGTYKNIKSDPAVFAWYLRAKCYNGEEIKRKGNVTLIR